VAAMLCLPSCYWGWRLWHLWGRQTWWRSKGRKDVSMASRLCDTHLTKASRLCDTHLTTLTKDVHRYPFVRTAVHFVAQYSCMVWPSDIRVSAQELGHI
jgi:hypothetical protein